MPVYAARRQVDHSSISWTYTRSPLSRARRTISQVPRLSGPGIAMRAPFPQRYPLREHNR